MPATVLLSPTNHRRDMLSGRDERAAATYDTHIESYLTWLNQVLREHGVRFALADEGDDGDEPPSWTMYIQAADPQEERQAYNALAATKPFWEWY